MRVSILRFPFLLLLTAILLLSGCQRQRTPAEVIYRSQLPQQQQQQHIPGEPGKVEQKELPSRPKYKIANTQVTIGLILPLTGPQAEIGKQMRDAALMGLYDAIDNSPRLDATATPNLIMKDNAGSKEKTEEVTQALINEGAQIILGPLVADNVKAAGTVAAKKNIPVIAFSNDIRIAQPNLFVFGFVPEQQVARIARFAAAQGIEHYSALAQQNEYGRMVVRDFSEYIVAEGYNVKPVEFINEGEMPASTVVTRLANSAEDVGRQRKAIFMPITGAALSAVSLRFLQDVKANGGYLKLLGTGLWDNPQTLRDPGMRDAWFATTSPKKSQDYNQRFYDQYQYAPARIASLAYDAVSLMARQGIAMGAKGVSRNQLTGNKGFDLEANGAVRFLPNGMVDRALAVVEVGTSGFRIIDTPKFGVEEE